METFSTKQWISALIHRYSYSDFKRRHKIEWFYTASYFVFVVFLLALTSSLPIDVIVQSVANNVHLATNSIIVWTILLALVFFYSVLHIVRLIFNKLVLQDIPKSYIPITKQDIGKKMSRIIDKEIIRSKKLRELAKPKGQVVHLGMYHKSNLESGYEKDLDMELPDNLIYENIVKIIGQEIKYNNTLTLNDNKVLHLSNKYTLREELRQVFRSGNSQLKPQKLEQFINVYEKLRYSGEPITLPEFKQFLKDWNYIKSTL